MVVRNKRGNAKERLMDREVSPSRAHRPAEATRWATRRATAGLVLFAIALAVTAPLAAQIATAAALSGFDPVALSEGREIEGKEAIAVDHQGYRYWFASKKNRKKFEKAPDLYRIQNQYCPVEPTAPALPDLFAVHDKKIYIFATPGCIEDFEAAPETYIKND